MSGSAIRVAACVLTVVAVSGCGGGGSSDAGEAVVAATPTESPSSSSPDTTTPPQAAEPFTPSPPERVEPGTVDLGDFAKKPQAVAVATFYEQLWKSYQTGSVTPSLARLTTGSALEAFRKNVKDLDRLGQTVAELNAARVVKVDGDEVVVCMASSSYQRLEARTGAAVNPKVPGVTEYVVELKKSPWRVDSAAGVKKPTCRKAAS